MTDTTGLPPGCAKLTFGKEDPKTWSAIQYLQFARVEIAEAADKMNVLGINHPGGTPYGECDRLYRLHQAEDKAFMIALADRFEKAASLISSGLSRLYDAAPEPVKPREWWAVLCGEFGQHAQMLFRYKIDATKFASNSPDYRLVRLIEAPEDQA